MAWLGHYDLWLGQDGAALSRSDMVHRFTLRNILNRARLSSTSIPMVRGSRAISSQLVPVVPLRTVSSTKDTTGT